MFWLFSLFLAVTEFVIHLATWFTPSYRSAVIKNPVNDTLPGIALVQYLHNYTNPICSGTFMKPWIVLTTAECVKDKKLEDLTVSLWYNAMAPHPYSNDSTGNQTDTTTLQTFKRKANVSKVYIDPTYSTNPENNFAILIIYGHENWTIGEYSVAPYELTQDLLQKKDLFLYMWLRVENLDLGFTLLVPAVQGNRTMCGPLLDKKNMYCFMDKNRQTYEYSHVDIGTPAFFGEGKQKMMFGIYTHYTPGEDIQGHAYQALWPRYDWIEEKCKEHPAPPA